MWLKSKNYQDDYTPFILLFIELWTFVKVRWSSRNLLLCDNFITNEISTYFKHKAVGHVSKCGTQIVYVYFMYVYLSNTLNRKYKDLISSKVFVLLWAALTVVWSSLGAWFYLCVADQDCSGCIMNMMNSILKWIFFTWNMKVHKHCIQELAKHANTMCAHSLPMNTRSMAMGHMAPLFMYHNSLGPLSGLSTNNGAQQFGPDVTFLYI